MKLSIVTPSYNQGDFLAATIESVISQTGDFFLDYVIIDGDSRDDSVAIIEHYADMLRQGFWRVNCLEINFRWLSEPDGGQTVALMKGFRMAEGEVFAWLNADDTYLPGALQAAADFFRDHPEAGLVYGNADYSDARGARIGSYRTAPFDLNRLASVNLICQPAAFFRRTAFETVGGLDETLHFAMDYDLWIRIGRRFPCRHLPQLLATYRLHGASKTVSAATLVANSEEALAVARRHFGWAPLTRVYTACHIRCAARIPLLAGNRLVLGAVSAVYTMVSSLWLNRGFNRNDLILLNRENFRKLFKSRLEIMTGEKP